MVRALFTIARIKQPSVIFIDEIDSLLTQRVEGEQESTRRIKTEFLVQFDGVGKMDEDRILVIGATNRPQELDEAARRRFRKRLYIPLPSAAAIRIIIKRLLSTTNHDLEENQIDDLVNKLKGYSGSDVDGVCREAAMGPIRSIGDIRNFKKEDVRGINHGDFINAMREVRSSVDIKELESYKEFEKEFGSLGI